MSVLDKFVHIVHDTGHLWIDFIRQMKLKPFSPGHSLIQSVHGERDRSVMNERVSDAQIYF